MAQSRMSKRIEYYFLGTTAKEIATHDALVRKVKHNTRCKLRNMAINIMRKYHEERV